MSEETYTKSWIRHGKRVNKLRNRDHKWGQGKVHWLIYISKTDERNVYRYPSGYYARLCKIDDPSEHALAGSGQSSGNVPKDEPVTCRVCLNREDGDL